jgi:hypothetical protein
MHHRLAFLLIYLAARHIADQDRRILQRRRGDRFGGHRIGEP